MTTREELAALSYEQLNERIASELFGWEPRIESNAYYEHIPETHWYPPDSHEHHDYCYVTLPHFSSEIEAAWMVVEHIMQPPTSEAVAKVAPNTRFMYAFQKVAQEFICSSEEDAARWICEQALLAWNAGPLFPEETSDG